MNIHIKGRLRHDSVFRQKFGIGLHQYETLLESQNRVCYLCERKDEDDRNLAVDHNHATGKVRRLLCGLCNKALGLLRDDPELMRKAAKYVETEFDLPEDVNIAPVMQDDKRRWRHIVETPEAWFVSTAAAAKYYDVDSTTIGVWCGIYDYYKTPPKEGFRAEKLFLSNNEARNLINTKYDDDNN